MSVSLFHKIAVALGLRAAAPIRNPAACALEDDFVARYGLSHAERPDLMTDEARLEAERQKSFFRNHR